MLKYKFTCPHCNTESSIIERATVVRYTDLIGFSKKDAEFSEHEDFDDASDFEYICSNCSNELDVHYEQLYTYVMEHGKMYLSNIEE
jgi:hypothetical protein